MASVIFIEVMIPLLNLSRVPGVPLSNVRDKIAGFVQQSGKGLVKAIVPLFTAGIFGLVSRIVLSRMKGRPGDPTNAGGDTIVCKAHALIAREPVNKGGLHHAIAGNSQGVVPPVIPVHDHDVQRLAIIDQPWLVLLIGLLLLRTSGIGVVRDGWKSVSGGHFETGGCEQILLQNLLGGTADGVVRSLVHREGDPQNDHD